MIDFTTFDFHKIFGVVKSTHSLRRPQMRALRAEIIEKCIAKQSKGQLDYCGDYVIGADFKGSDNLMYESKCVDGLWQKKSPFLKEVTLKNFQSKNKGLPEKTFDWMLLWDTTNMSMFIAHWDDVIQHAKVKDAAISFKLPKDKVKVIVWEVATTEKEDFSKHLDNLIHNLI